MFFKSKTNTQQTPKKKKGLKFWLSVSVSASLFLATILLVIWFIILRDPVRNTHVRSEATSAEIIKKNLVKGFENTENTGKFTYILSQDDINDLLDDGVQTLGDKHIESIYFEFGENGIHTFYVDLTRTFFITRVVVTTYVEDYGTDYINLKIVTTKMGKMESTKYLTRKGYLTSEWMDKYFEASNLPIKFDETSKTFRVEIKNYFKGYNEGKIASKFMNLALQDKSALSVNPTNFGFTVDFSKSRSKETIEINNSTTPVPNFYNEIKSGCEAIDVSSMADGEERIAYSISESDFANELKKDLPSETKEEIVFGEKKVTFDLLDAQPTFKENNRIGVSLIFSVNGYLVNFDGEVGLYDYSGTYFEASIEINQENQFFVGFLEEIFKKVQENHANLFEYSESEGSLNIDFYETNSHFESDLRDAFKTVEINLSTKTIDFIVTKTI